MLEAFRPGRERERDRTQLLSPAHHQSDSVKQECGGSSGVPAGQQQPLPASPLLSQPTATAYLAAATTASLNAAAAPPPPTHTTTSSLSA